MNMKIIGGGLGLALLIGFLLPPVAKLQEVSLIVVALIGIGMAVYEFFENIRSKDD